MEGVARAKGPSAQRKMSLAIRAEIDVVVSCALSPAAAGLRNPKQRFDLPRSKMADLPLSLTTIIVVVILLCALLLRIFDDLKFVFLLAPGHAVTRPWMVLTAGYFEDSGINLAVGLGALLGFNALLKDKWAEPEVAKYVLFTNAAQGCLSWVGMIVLYVLFREEHFLFARLGGLSGLLGGLAVAARQFRLKHSVRASLPPSLAADNGPIPQLIEMCLAHAPSLCVLWTTLVLLTTHAGPPDELLFSLNGILAGWVYLRYYQPAQDAEGQRAGACGDASQAFGFAELWPPPLQPPLRVLGQALYIVASGTGAFPPTGWGVLDGGALALAEEGRSGEGSALLSTPIGNGGGVELEALSSPLPPTTTSDPEVAERRRERARALIEARLAEKQASAASEGDGANTPGEPTPQRVGTPVVGTPTPAPPQGEEAV